MTLGLYEMSEANTPGVGATLARGLGALPEADCYVRFEETRIDVTRAGILPAAPISFQYEESIEPDQSGEYDGVDGKILHVFRVVTCSSCCCFAPS